MRLDRFLSNLKYGTRTEVKKLIKDKQVTVNGKSDIGPETQINPEADEITVNGETVRYKEFVYLMLNKPQGVISATFDNVHKTVIDLVATDYSRYDLFPCGRLDIDTEGLLILSNDGQFAHELTHPKKSVYKKYYAQTDEIINSEAVYRFKQGLTIPDGNNEPYKTKPAHLEIVSPKSAYVYIPEGKFHQVKRMFEALNNHVNYLKRLSIGRLLLDERLQPGAYRELSETEINLLFENILEELE